MFDSISKEELMEYASVLDKELPKQFFEDAQKIWEGKNKKGKIAVTEKLEYIKDTFQLFLTIYEY